VSFQGGVASNAGMRRAFEEVLELGRGELVVDQYHLVMGALGVARVLIDEPAVRRETAPCNLGALEAHIKSQTTEVSDLEPLAGALEQEAEGERQEARGQRQEAAAEKLDVYLGIDVGSVSTNVALIDSEGRLIAKRYLATAGRPIEAVRRGIEEIYHEVGDRVIVRGCGTTGSGRYLIGDLVGADVIRNEITAQATAAIAIDPSVDTIFEIGGQDSKYVSINDGAVCDFEMNKVCAAGTGSFLEEQAERLGLNIEEEFAERALQSRSPVALGDRCTVFMESDLLHHQHAGAGKEDLVAGLAYSIVYNYLNRVVGDGRIGERIFFQGGTAFNRAVVAAFNRVLGKVVVVPPHHEVTGAIGVARLARDHMLQFQDPRSRFKGFDWSRRRYEIGTFTCNKCPNSCEIRRVQVENDRPLYYGSRCERFEVDRGHRGEHLPDLFAERARALHAWMEDDDFPSRGAGGPSARAGAPSALRPKGRVGIPMTLLFHEFLPMWGTFFRALGFEVVLSGDTTKAIINEGIEQVVTEVCYPVKVAHGHVAALARDEVDFIFLPSVINAMTPDHGPRDPWSFNCPLVQAIPYTVQTADEVSEHSELIFSPVLYMQSSPRSVFQSLARHRSVLRSSRREIWRALKRGYEAQERFGQWLVERGRQALDALAADEKALVIVSRPYNGCDAGVNLSVPKHLRALGVLAIPMDMLALDPVPVPSDWRHIYWRYGQRIIKAAELVRRDPRLFPVYITNFSCGPDSFLLNFFDRALDGKPYLQIEIDEHSADAGVVTRCEAFLDTLANYRPSAPGEREPAPFGSYLHSYTDGRRIYVPDMASQAYAVAAAMRSVGVDAEVMAESNNESLALGRKYTSGKECYPALLTAGDMIRQSRRSDFDPARAAFFMGAADGPCRFGQYSTLHRLVLDEIGLRDVPLYVVDQDEDFRQDIQLAGGQQFERRAWIGICAVDALERLLLSTRPYEVRQGETDRWFARSVHAVCEAIASGRSADPALRQARREHERIETHQRGSRPLIGVVGEIYVRANRFANDYVIERIERLGGEVVIPPMAEWLHYSRDMRSRRKWWRRDFGALLGNVVRGKFQIALERHVYGQLGLEPDPPVANTLDLARPYLDSSFEGEAILTLGKSVELIRDRNAAGIVNTMPFTCMPGTIVTALMKRVREDYRGIPVLTMIYPGQQTLANRIRLEAFMYQARRFRGAEH